MNELDYLSYVIKEVLRIDGPAVESLPYKSLADIEICGVPIPKDKLIFMNTISRSYNTDEWHEPLNFIPERFDPTSEYYTRPKDGKPRDSLSYSPFSLGARS